MTQSSRHTAYHGEELDFIRFATDAFSFLEPDYGFHQVVATPTLVRYERGPFFVNIICEVGLNVLIGRAARVRDGLRGILKRLRHEWGAEFPLEYVAMKGGLAHELGTDHLTVRCADDVRVHLPRLAEFTRTHASKLLAGEPAAYSEMADLSRSRSRELTQWAAGRGDRTTT